MRGVVVFVALLGCGRIGFELSDRNGAVDAAMGTDAARTDAARTDASALVDTAVPAFQVLSPMAWGNIAAGTSLTQSYTVPTSASAVLVVAAGGDVAANGTSVTFDGTPLVVGEQVTGTTLTLTLFYLDNPPAVTANLVASYPQPMGRVLMALVLEGTGATPIASARNTAASAPISTMISVPSGPAVLIDAQNTYDATTLPAVEESGQMLLATASNGGFDIGAMSLLEVANAGTTVVGWQAQQNCTDYSEVVLAFTRD